ncbi:protein-tyrosine phosphatase-like protein [Pilaira anomala]|nr:protein-tyrosine phosphatase-like protein [Pilaira anomala]
MTSMELLKSILMDKTRFQHYAHQKFSRILELEKERSISTEYQHKEARRNESLNRYSNIFPFDNNCIKLSDKRLGDREYINASWILAPYGIPKSYIATQGPIQSTLVDFWRLVIEKEVTVIVCLTPEIENKMEKCARYWPIGDESLNLEQDGISVTIKNIKTERQDRDANCIVRTISVEFFDSEQILIKKQRVTQLHFLGWPDHGVPNDTKNVISLIRLTRQFQEGMKPVLVHCSAGCGRTGTFCVIDSGEALLKEKKDLLIDPVFLLTDAFRKQRTTMVQAQAQYNFCYKALKDFIDTEE